MNRYVYLVRFHPLMYDISHSHFKVGYSEKLTLGKQLSRYKTYYPQFEMLAYNHMTPKKFEHYLKWKLQEHNIRSELFHEDGFDTAVDLCERECKLIEQHYVKTPNNDFLL